MDSRAAWLYLHLPEQVSFGEDAHTALESPSQHDLRWGTANALCHCHNLGPLHQPRWHHDLPAQPAAADSGLHTPVMTQPPTAASAGEDWRIVTGHV